MKKTIWIYIEGGGKGNTSALRDGFATFFESLEDRAHIKAVLCRGKDDARDKYDNERKHHPDADCLLLIDSDRPPPYPDDGPCFMAQAMEAWFLSDHEMLSDYFRIRPAFKSFGEVERIPDPKDRLKAEIKKRTPDKREYEEVRDGARLLAKIRPAQVRDRAPQCERLFAALERLIQG